MREQLVLHVELEGSIKSAAVQVRAINGEEIANWQDGPRYADYLRQLVRAGWTIARVVDSATLIFERPSPYPQIARAQFVAPVHYGVVGNPVQQMTSS